MPLSNTQYEEIMRGYEQRRLERQRLIRLRTEEAYERSAIFASLDEEAVSAAGESAKRSMSGDENAGADLAAKLQSISFRREQELSRLGYPSDWLNPPYTCPICQDTGYVSGHRCKCFMQESVNILYSQSNLKAALLKENFDNFNLDYYPDDIFVPGSEISCREAAYRALRKCKDFAKNFGKSEKSLLLIGDTGLGKTFLSHCIAKDLIERGFFVVYLPAGKLTDILIGNSFSHGEKSEEYQNIMECDLLIIDDLGTECPNSLSVSKLYSCINERQCSGKPLVISTNLSPKDIAEQYSERIFSRIYHEFTCAYLFGTDIREIINNKA